MAALVFYSSTLRVFLHISFAKCYFKCIYYNLFISHNNNLIIKFKQCSNADITHVISVANISNKYFTLTYYWLKRHNYQITICRNLLHKVIIHLNWCQWTIIKARLKLVFIYASHLINCKCNIIDVRHCTREYPKRNGTDVIVCENFIVPVSRVI